MKPEHQTDLARFLGELRLESDRGLALVGAAVIDDKLRATLAAFFVDCSAVPKLIDQGNVPLGAFSARADACLALGLIDDFEYSEITLVRRIRNEFAHGLHGTHFNTEPINGYCSSLRSNLPEDYGQPKLAPRFRFMNSVVLLAMRLYYRPDWVARERRVAKEWIGADQVRWRSLVDEPPPTDKPVLGIGKQDEGSGRDQ
jgi:hypothetical protein